MNMHQQKIFIGVVALLILFGGWYIARPHITGNILRIGVILPLTGNGSDQGAWVQEGLKLAEEEINVNRYNVALVFQDAPNGDPKAAISAYRNLQSMTRVPVVFTWGSGVGNALTPIVNEEGVVQMGVATAADSYSTPDDYTFRNFPRASAEGDYLSGIMRRLGADRMAVTYINNDYGESSAEAFIASYKTAGGVIVFRDSFNSGASDFRTLIAKLKATRPTHIYLAAYPTEGALFLKQARELGVQSQTVASVAILGSTELFSLAGEALEHLIVVSPLAVSPSDPELRDFARRYEKRFGFSLDSQNIYSILSYNALKTVFQVAEPCQYDATCIKKRLYEITYPAIGERVTFDRNGDVMLDFHLLRIENGNFVPYEP